MSEITKTYTVCDMCGERGEPFQPGSKFLRQHGRLILYEDGVNYDGSIGSSRLDMDLCEDCYSRLQEFLNRAQKTCGNPRRTPIGQLKLRGIEDEFGNTIYKDLTKREFEDTIELFTAPTVKEDK